MINAPRMPRPTGSGPIASRVLIDPVGDEPAQTPTALVNHSESPIPSVG